MAYAFGFPHGMGTGMGFGLGFLNFLGTLLFILALVWVIRWFVSGGGRWGYGPRHGWGGAGPRGPRSGEGWQHGLGRWMEDPAMDTARERLARGEIDAAAFEALKQELSADAPTPPWRRDDALGMARMRLARSEITAAEYQALRKLLQG